MKDHPRRGKAQPLGRGKAVRPSVHCPRGIAERSIRKKRHCSLGVTRYKAELYLVTAFVIAMGEPTAVGNDVAQGRRGGHAAAFWGKPWKAATLPLTKVQIGRHLGT